LKLIIEKIDGRIYAYRESKSHFERASKTRGTVQLDPEKLDHECDLGHYDDFHMVFDVKKPKKKAKK
jgi:hypothetical protein